MKKIISFVIFCLMVLNSFTVFAKNIIIDNKDIYGENFIYPTGKLPKAKINEIPVDVKIEDDDLSLYNTGNIMDEIIKAAEKGETIVDNLIGYKADKDKFVAEIIDFLYRHPQLLILRDENSSISISYDKSTNYIATVRFEYLIPTNELKAAREIIESKVSKVVAKVQGMDDLSKILYVHDYLADNTSYDPAVADNDPATVEKITTYSIYGALVDNIAVCEGYAETFGYFLTRLGINHRSCASESINHIWNYVELNNKWYHVDVTWDDPLPADNIDNGTITHDFFLIPDDVSISNHFDSNEPVDLYSYDKLPLPICDDYSYSEGYIFNNSVFTSPLTFENGKYSYTKFGKEYLFETNTLKKGEIEYAKPFINKGDFYLLIYLTEIAPEENKEVQFIRKITDGDLDIFNVPVTKQPTIINFGPFDPSILTDKSKFMVWNMANLMPYGLSYQLNIK